MKAVIPAAGFGIRFLPMTKEQPKEMLPVIHKPTIQYVVEEAIASGITDILIITGRGKRSIEDHFDSSPELEKLLEQRGRLKELEEIRSFREFPNIHFIRQREPRGLGDAVLLARHHVGNEPFAVMLGDTINLSPVPVIKQLMNVHEQKGGSVISVEQVPREKLKDYGIIKGREISERLYAIEDLVEKPSPEQAPSNLGITGRYIISPRIFDILERTPAGKGGEVQLTDALRILNQFEDIYGYVFEGTRYDIGDKIGWLKTQFQMALDDPEMGPALRPFVTDLLTRKK